MQLYMDSRPEPLDNPSDQDLASLLPQEGEFAIISDGPDSRTFLQFAWDDEEPRALVLEYQDGSLETHFCAHGEVFTIDQVILAFQKYARGDASWRKDFRWQHMTI